MHLLVGWICGRPEHRLLTQTHSVRLQELFEQNAILRMDREVGILFARKQRVWTVG